MQGMALGAVIPLFFFFWERGVPGVNPLVRDGEMPWWCRIHAWFVTNGWIGHGLSMHVDTLDGSADLGEILLA
jgi:hypothetical protein